MRSAISKTLMAILLFWLTPKAEAAVSLDEIKDGQWLGPFFETIQLDNAQASDVIDRSSGFQKTDDLVPNFGYTEKQYWARIHIDNKSQESKDYYFVFKGPIEIVKMYRKIDGRIQEHITGMFADKKHNIDFRYPTFKISLHPGVNTLLFTQEAVAPHYPVKIFRPDAFYQFRYTEHMIAAFLYGISLIILVVALYIFMIRPTLATLSFTVSYASFLIFSLFVTGAARPAFNLLASALGRDLFWLEQKIYHNWTFWWGCLEFASLTFAWNFLELKRHSSKLAVAFQILGLISSACLAIFSYFAPVFSINVFAPMYHVLVFMYAYISFKRYRSGFYPAKNLTIAWVIYASFISLQLAYFFGLTGPTFLTSWELLIGTLLQFIFFGVSIADKKDFIETRLRQQKDEEQAKVVAAKRELEVNFEKLKTFGEALKVFVSPALVIQIHSGENPLAYQPKFVRRIITFTDMRNYTKFAESRDLVNTHKSLNNCFQLIMDPVFDLGGEVDKLIGDAVMSIFFENLLKNALEAILIGRKNLSAQNRELIKNGLAPIKFGTGIAIGEVLSANFGNGNKMDRTVVGDAVNIASRLESETKNYKVDILASLEIVQSLGKYEYMRPIDSIVLKGKHQETPVFEIFGHNSPQIQEWKISTIGSLQEVAFLKAEFKYADCVRIIEELIRRCPPHSYKPDAIMDMTLITLLNSFKDHSNHQKELYRETA